MEDRTARDPYERKGVDDSENGEGHGGQSGGAVDPDAVLSSGSAMEEDRFGAG
jgi:hypothetical protein